MPLDSLHDTTYAASPQLRTPDVSVQSDLPHPYGHSAKSFARIHRQHLVNFGIPPLIPVDPADYDRLNELDEVVAAGIADALRRGESSLALTTKTGGGSIALRHDLSGRERNVVLAEGGLNYIRARA